MDLGVLRSKTFCYDKHAQKVALKATKLTGMTMKIFSSQEPAFYDSYLSPISGQRLSMQQLSGRPLALQCVIP